MSQKTGITLSNLQLELSNIRSLEKKMNDLAKSDDTKVSEVRKVQMEIQFKMGQFDKSFQEFLKEEGLPNNFHLLDLIAHFWEKSKKTLVVAS